MPQTAIASSRPICMVAMATNTGSQAHRPLEKPATIAPRTHGTTSSPAVAWRGMSNRPSSSSRWRRWNGAPDATCRCRFNYHWRITTAAFAGIIARVNRAPRDSSFAENSDSLYRPVTTSPTSASPRSPRRASSGATAPSRIPSQRPGAVPSASPSSPPCRRALGVCGVSTSRFPSVLIRIDDSRFA